MAPIATASTSDPVPMELDAILRAREEGEEEYSKDSAKEEAEALFFMEPDHNKVRTKKDPEAHDYWEAGLTTDTISALKTGNVDHSQKSCYHCSRKGHIKANCPERRKLGAWPWTKMPWPRGKKNHSTKRIQSRKRMWKTVLLQTWHYQKTIPRSTNGECTSPTTVG